MSSENAKNVALDVIKKIQNGGKIVLGEIVENRGYSQSTIKHPKRVTKTKSYMKVTTPFVERMIAERTRIQKALENKDLTDEHYKDLVSSLDTFTKNIQLLSGGVTERTEIAIEDENAIKNAINAITRRNN